MLFSSKKKKEKEEKKKEKKLNREASLRSKSKKDFKKDIPFDQNAIFGQDGSVEGLSHEFYILFNKSRKFFVLVCC